MYVQFMIFIRKCLYLIYSIVFSFLLLVISYFCLYSNDFICLLIYHFHEIVITFYFFRDFAYFFIFLDSFYIVYSLIIHFICVLILPNFYITLVICFYSIIIKVCLSFSFIIY